MMKILENIVLKLNKTIAKITPNITKNFKTFIIVDDLFVVYNK